MGKSFHRKNVGRLKEEIVLKLQVLCSGHHLLNKFLELCLVCSVIISFSNYRLAQQLVLSRWGGGGGVWGWRGVTPANEEQQYNWRSWRRNRYFHLFHFIHFFLTTVFRILINEKVIQTIEGDVTWEGKWPNKHYSRLN